MTKKEFATIKQTLHNYQNLQEFLLGEECNFADFSSDQMDFLNNYYE